MTRSYFESWLKKKQKKTGALRASRSAVPNHDRTNEVWGAWLSEQDAKPCFRASAHLNQELRVPKLREANENPDALSWCVVEKASWIQNSPPLSIFVILGRICVLKGRKETLDLAEYFPPLKMQIGPKIKKMASDYFLASVLTAKQVQSSVIKTGDPYQFSKTGAERSEPKTVFFPLWICIRYCKREMFSSWCVFWRSC